MLIFSGERFRLAREAAGISCQDLATAFGVNRQTIYKWQWEVNLPDINQILFIADVLKVPIAALFRDIDAREYKEQIQKKVRKGRKYNLNAIIEAETEKQAEQIAKKKGVWKE